MIDGRVQTVYAPLGPFGSDGARMTVTRSKVV